MGTMRYLPVLILLLAPTAAGASCFQDLGQRAPQAFRQADQMAALSRLARERTCDTYAIVWTHQSESRDQVRHLLLFSAESLILIRASYARARKKESYAAESWAAVSRDIVRAGHGLNPKYYVRLTPGNTWIVSDRAAAFLRENRAGDFLDEDFLTTHSDPPDDAETPDPSPAAAQATTRPQPPPPPPTRVADVAHLRCLQAFGQRNLAPSQAALASLAQCQSELAAATEAAARAEAERAELPRPESDRLRTSDIERQLAETKDLDELRRLAGQIPLDEARDYWLGVIDDKMRHLELCLKELDGLGARPSDLARRYEEDCQWELFAAKSKAGGAH